MKNETPKIINAYSNVSAGRADEGASVIGVQINLGDSGNLYLNPEDLTLRSDVLRKLQPYWVTAESQYTPSKWPILDRPDLVTPLHSWSFRIQTAEITANELELVKLFEECGRSLLIVGEEGTGKETLIYHLAFPMLKRAIENPEEKIPVILPLSSWSDEYYRSGQSFVDSFNLWLIHTVSKNNPINEKLGKKWIEKNELLFLLFDLDEINEPHRKACVTALNEFISNHQPLDIAVCCRTREYELLETPLHLHRAVELLPTSLQQVHHDLGQAGKRLSGLSSAIENHEILGVLARFPEDLAVMKEVYQDDVFERLPPDDSLETYKDFLYEQYVELKLKNESAESRGNITRWLSWIADKMKQYPQVRTWFLVEEMQPHWLSAPLNRLHAILSLSTAMVLLGIPIFGLNWFGIDLAVRDWARNEFRPFGMLVPIAIGLMIGLIASRKFSRKTKWGVFLLTGLAFAFIVGFIGGQNDLTWALISGVAALCFFGGIFAYFFGYTEKWLSRWTISSSGDIHIIEKLHWNYQFGMKGLWIGLVMASFLGILLELSVAWGQDQDFTAHTFYGALTCGTPLAIILDQINLCTHPLAIAISQPAPIVFGLLLLLLFGLQSEGVVQEDQVQINRSVKGSLQNAIKYGVISGLAAGTPFIYSGIQTALLFTERNITLIMGLGFGLSTALTIAIAIALLLGGFSSIQHYLLRLILAYKKAIPWNLEDFLLTTRDLELMVQRGGGFEFRFRRLLDYFSRQFAESD